MLRYQWSDFFSFYGISGQKWTQPACLFVCFLINCVYIKGISVWEFWWWNGFNIPSLSQAGDFVTFHSPTLSRLLSTMSPISQYIMMQYLFYVLCFCFSLKKKGFWLVIRKCTHSVLYSTQSSLSFSWISSLLCLSLSLSLTALKWIRCG